MRTTERDREKERDRDTKISASVQSNTNIGQCLKKVFYFVLLHWTPFFDCPSWEFQSRSPRNHMRQRIVWTNANANERKRWTKTVNIIESHTNRWPVKRRCIFCSSFLLFIVWLFGWDLSIVFISTPSSRERNVQLACLLKLILSRW